MQKNEYHNKFYYEDGLSFFLKSRWSFAKENQIKKKIWDFVTGIQLRNQATPFHNMVPLV